MKHSDIVKNADAIAAVEALVEGGHAADRIAISKLRAAAKNGWVTPALDEVTPLGHRIISELAARRGRVVEEIHCWMVRSNCSLGWWYCTPACSSNSADGCKMFETETAAKGVAERATRTDEDGKTWSAVKATVRYVLRPAIEVWVDGKNEAFHK